MWNLISKQIKSLRQARTSFFSFKIFSNKIWFLTDVEELREAALVGCSVADDCCCCEGCAWADNCGKVSFGSGNNSWSSDCESLVKLDAAVVNWVSMLAMLLLLMFSGVKFTLLAHNCCSVGSSFRISAMEETANETLSHPTIRTHSPISWRKRPKIPCTLLVPTRANNIVAGEDNNSNYSLSTMKGEAKSGTLFTSACEWR